MVSFASLLCKQKSPAFISDWLIGTVITMGRQWSNQKWKQIISALRALMQSSPLLLTSPQWFALKEHSESKNALFPHLIAALGLLISETVNVAIRNEKRAFLLLEIWFKAHHGYGQTQSWGWSSPPMAHAQVQMYQVIREKCQTKNGLLSLTTIPGSTVQQ